MNAFRSNLSDCLHRNPQKRDPIMVYQLLIVFVDLTFQTRDLALFADGSERCYDSKAFTFFNADR
jgi:hypothetical protein